MKYAEFLRLKEKMDYADVPLVELKEKPENALNEIFGIRKALISWGIKEYQKNRLENAAKKLKHDIEDTVGRAIKKYLDNKREIKQQIEELPKGREIPRSATRQIHLIENKILEVTSSSIQKAIKLKTSQIEEKIEGSKKLKPSHKLALKYYWNKLITDIEISALSYFLRRKFIEHPDLVDKVNIRAEDLEKEARQEAIETNRKIQQMKKGEGESNKGIVRSASEPGPDQKLGTADDAIVDPKGKGNASEIDTPFLQSFTVQGSDGSKLQVEASGLYDDWKRVFNVQNVEGPIASKFTTNSVVVFNKRKIKIGESIRFDIYDFNTGNYTDSVVIQEPSKITDYQWRPEDVKDEPEIEISPPPDDLDIKKETPVGKAKNWLDHNVGRFRELRKKYKKDEGKTKELMTNFRSAMKNFADEVNKVKNEKIKNEIIEYTEKKIKGSQKSLFPDYRPIQTKTSEEDKEITG